MNKDHPPNKKAGYILMAADGEAGTKAVPVSEFIEEYLLTDEVANYILDKYNLKASGEKEIEFKAIPQFINKQFRKFYGYSFNEINLPMIWCVGKLYSINSIDPFVMILSPYYEAVVVRDFNGETYQVPQSIIFDGGASWYYNTIPLLNVGEVNQAHIPVLRIHPMDMASYRDVAYKLYEIAEVKYD